MPYIETKARKELDPFVNDLIEALGAEEFKAGELNYVITKILHATWKQNERYDTINKIMGVMECAKQEFYRRVATPYEDAKIRENGDV